MSTISSIKEFSSSVNQSIINSDNQNVSQNESSCRKEDLHQTLDQLKRQKEDLLFQLQIIQSSIKEIDQKIVKTEAQIQKEDKNQIVTTIQKLEKLTVTSKLAKPLIIVHKNETVKSYDNVENQTGAREHYSVSLVTQDDKEIIINENWSLIQKYGKIQHIVISDGEKEIELYNSVAIERLKDYLSTEFNVFRKQINQDKIDKNGYYPNKYQQFDCQRFSYFLQHGKEGTYIYDLNSDMFPSDANYRKNGEHMQFCFYSIKGYTSTFGSKEYNRDDISIHYYMSLGDDVFVSKFGKSDVLFTSYQQIITAYFPEKFTKGERKQLPREFF